MQRVVDILYPEFKKEEDKIKKNLYIAKMKELGKDVEKDKKLKKEQKLMMLKKDQNQTEEKSIDFLLLPCTNLVEDVEPMEALDCQSFKTSEKKDVKYIKRFLAHKLKASSWEDIDIYWYDHNQTDNRELSWVFNMIWKNHQMTKMKPKEESEILILNYCKKGTYKSKE